MHHTTPITEVYNQWWNGPLPKLRRTHWLLFIYKSLIDKVTSYLCSRLTIHYPGNSYAVQPCNASWSDCHCKWDFFTDLTGEIKNKIKSQEEPAWASVSDAFWMDAKVRRLCSGLVPLGGSPEEHARRTTSQDPPVRACGPWCLCGSARTAASAIQPQMKQDDGKSKRISKMGNQGKMLALHFHMKLSVVIHCSPENWWTQSPTFFYNKKNILRAN